MINMEQLDRKFEEMFGKQNTHSVKIADENSSFDNNRGGNPLWVGDVSNNSHYGIHRGPSQLAEIPEED